MVQWVVPPAVSSANSKSQQAKRKQNYKSQNSNCIKSNTISSSSPSTDSNSWKGSKENCNYNFTRRRFSSQSSSIASETVPPIVDEQTYKTICTFVQEYLRELQEHQQLINKARSNLINSSSLNQANKPASVAYNKRAIESPLPDITYITRNDTFKLKVRDQQIRANETIKRLTNYLRELSYLESQYNGYSEEATASWLPNRPGQHAPSPLAIERSKVDEEIITKLSDLRSDIIQALNNFVLSNSDIDCPIIDADDINKYDYDLCIDAQTPSTMMKRLSELTNSQQQTSFSSSTLDADKKDTDICSRIGNRNLDNSTQQQEQQQLLTSQSMMRSLSSSVLCSQDYLDRRNREIRKLERETAELKRLFSDFYDLVRAQGEQVDTIADNIVIATHRISEGQHSLNKSMRGLTIIMPVTGCITGALIGGPLGLVVGGKLGGITIGCVTSLLGLLSSLSVQRCMTSNELKDD